MLLLLSLLLSLIFQICNSTTILVDGVSEWKNPTVHVGDSIIFKHKYHYNLYIFQNQRAFNLCNFTQASLLTKPNSISYTVSPPQPPVELSPAAAPIPAPISGGEVSSSPAYPWPFRPREEASSPAPVPSSVGASSPMTVPTVIPSDKGGGSSMPFINSNPAVPLPTGEVDSATIRPLPASGHHQQVPLSYHTHCEKRGEKKNERKKFLLI
ncbi:hypothetical protein JCGZ_15195 [Jatropha curcas]|uniref:Phytocyanin domain-containing protein n=1 Tax=Jatropha curcas TaxID=180498 RepID=A0A067K3I7_JATCU|nr:flocculation protein FLO11 isoform X2 [Jatropha curcas]KDP30766.1 hypothetical protein JCGZ_15195 [Jatropha curcas]